MVSLDVDLVVVASALGVASLLVVDGVVLVAKGVGGVSSFTEDLGVIAADGVGLIEVVVLVVVVGGTSPHKPHVLRHCCFIFSKVHRLANVSQNMDSS